jgi:predicted DCC family thiol-disulfide oxidoreductase YuxK
MIRIYYNQKCTVCNIEISHYKKKNISNLIWVDINSPSEDLKLLGKSHKEMMRRLHVIDDKTIYSGAIAFIILWSHLPNYKLLSKILNLPIIFQVFNIFYEFIAFLLFIKNNRSLS